MRDRIRRRLGLTITLVLFVFAIMLGTALLSSITLFILSRIGVITLPGFVTEHQGMKNGNPLLSLIGISLYGVFLGTALTAFLSRIALTPVRKVINATREIATGNFDARVDIKGVGELEELAGSFDKMALELSNTETLRGDFINNFSHEFKTPITSIRGFAKLLKEGELSDAERSDYLDIIIQQSERLSDLSTNVLNLSKYENLEIITEKKPFRLDEQIRRTVVLLEPKWSKKELTLNADLEDAVYNGNEDLLQQVWINLLDNAIKFTERGGVISLKLTSSASEFCISIQDDGCGMDERTLDHAFDKFFQGDASRVKTGNGLGLAMVKRIVGLCGGKVDVQSARGEGTVFTVCLPK